MAKFKEFSKDISKILIEFSKKRNTKIGDCIMIGDQQYTLTHKSISSSKFWHSSSISIYFHNKRSIIRISNHWSKSNNFPHCKKLNCGRIGINVIGYDKNNYPQYSRGQFWQLDDKTDQRFEEKYSVSRYPITLIAGKCGLSVLNKQCNHWHK